VLTRATGVFVAIGMLASTSSAAELLKVSVPQRGQWDTAVTELGMRGGMFEKYGLDIELLYTQGGPESHQAVISGSMDVACGGGIESVIGAYSRGAPLRIIGSEMIGSPDTYWYVPSNSPIKSLADAAGKTISYSQNGSSSHTALLSLLEQYHVDANEGIVTSRTGFLLHSSFEQAQASLFNITWSEEWLRSARRFQRVRWPCSR
jgi:NitT/TauT family transport system substrate-binding protein